MNSIGQEPSCSWVTFIERRLQDVMQHKTTIERAYELAASGRFPDLYVLEKALKQEGRSDVRAQISGRQIRKALMQRCRTSFAEHQASAPLEEMRL